MCQKFRKTLIRVSRESYLPSSEIDSDILDHLREYTYLLSNSSRCMKVSFNVLFMARSYHQ